MVNCPSCNFSNTEGTRFCVKCGTPLQADASPGATTSGANLQPTVLAPSQKTMLDDSPPPLSPPTPSVPDSSSIPTMYAPYTPASPVSPGATSGGVSSGGSSPGMTSGGQGAPGYGSFGNAPASGGFGSQGGLPAPGGFTSGAPLTDAGGTAPGSTQVNPPLAAIISFFFPGLGLLLVPNKLPLALGIFGGAILLSIILFVLAGVLSYSLESSACTLCIFPVPLLISIGAAIFTFDTAAKLSNGQYKPLIFKK